MSERLARGSVSGAARGAARGADDWVERVRAASDIVEIVRQTVSLKRVGRNWTGLCPFHKEKTPSFSVHAERQFYHCFSCKAGGDVFKFVQETEKVGFLEAVELLSRSTGIPVPDVRSGGAERGIKARLLEALEAATTAYEQWLGDPSSGASTRAYLERRGLTRDTIRGFRLGLAPAGWENLTQRLREKVPTDILVQAGLAAPRGGDDARPSWGGVYDRFRNRLMVPLVAPGGAVIGFGARALAEEDQPKYLNSPETPVYHKGGFLFALEQARRKVTMEDEMIVVEGYFDAIALHQAGLPNCVATSGTALTGDQARLLRRVVGRVALTYDGDAAGRDAMMRSLGVLLGEGLEVVVVDLPQGEDPDTLVRRGGIEAWNAVRRQAADPAEFVQRHVLRAAAGAAGGGDARSVGAGPGAREAAVRARGRAAGRCRGGARARARAAPLGAERGAAAGRGGAGPARAGAGARAAAAPGPDPGAIGPRRGEGSGGARGLSGCALCRGRALAVERGGRPARGGRSCIPRARAGARGAGGAGLVGGGPRGGAPAQGAQAPAGQAGPGPGAAAGGDGSRDGIATSAGDLRDLPDH